MVPDETIHADNRLMLALQLELYVVARRRKATSKADQAAGVAARLLPVGVYLVPRGAARERFAWS